MSEKILVDVALLNALAEHLVKANNPSITVDRYCDVEKILCDHIKQSAAHVDDAQNLLRTIFARGRYDDAK